MFAFNGAKCVYLLAAIYGTVDKTQLTIKCSHTSWLIFVSTK